jgi:hypothetical protein
MKSRKMIILTMLVACIALAMPSFLFSEGAKEQQKPAVAVEAAEGAKEKPNALIIKEAKTGKEVSCFSCHGSQPAYPVLGAKQGYEVSGHKTNGNSAYANAGGCEQCHTNEGFITWVEKGALDPKAWVEYPSQPGCYTCHAPHENGNFDLRTVKPVTLANNVVFDLGSGNLCASCHRARSVAATTAVSMPANKLNANWGAHHGPQADLLAGTNAFEFPGKIYSSAMHSKVIADGCVQCHMSLPDGRYSFSPAIGGHSFNIASDVHEQPKVNLSGCISCHKDIAQVAGKEIYAIAAKEDYDLDGTKEPLQAEVQGLLNRFVNPAGTGLLQKSTPALYKPDGTWQQPTTDAQLGVGIVGALYNYKMVLEDRSLGVHNATYVIQVLYDSIQALDAGFDVSRRPK